MEIKELTFIPILGTIIFLTSLIKIPSIFPGAEFQMSATNVSTNCNDIWSQNLYFSWFNRILFIFLYGYIKYLWNYCGLGF